MGDLISCIEDDPTKCDLATGYATSPPPLPLLPPASHPLHRLLPDLPCKKMLKSCDELEVRALRNIFDQFDVDNDGSITRVELRDSLIRFGKKPTDKSVDKMVRQLDLTVDTGRAKSSSIFNFSSGRDSASRKKSADDGAIDFADFSRGMLARNSLLCVRASARTSARLRRVREQSSARASERNNELRRARTGVNARAELCACSMRAFLTHPPVLQLQVPVRGVRQYGGGARGGATRQGAEEADERVLRYVWGGGGCRSTSPETHRQFGERGRDGGGGRTSAVASFV